MISRQHIKKTKELALLGAVYKIVHCRMGAVNRTSFLDTETGRFVLRAYSKRARARIEKDALLLRKLKNLPVPHPLFFKGRAVFFVGKHPAMLYPYISGEPSRQPNKAQARAVGVFLGRFHRLGGTFSWQGPKDKFYELSNSRLKAIRKIVLQKKLPRLALLDELSRAVEAYRLSPSLPKGPIHVDIKPDNVLFAGDTLSGVVDFDNAYRGPFLLDLAKAIVWFARRRSGFDFGIARALYNGYLSMRRLTKQEEQELYKAVHYAFVSHIIVDFDMYAKGSTARRYFEFMTTAFFDSYRAFRCSEGEFNKRMREK